MLIQLESGGKCLILHHLFKGDIKYKYKYKTQVPSGKGISLIHAKYDIEKYIFSSYNPQYDLVDFLLLSYTLT